MKRIVWDDTSFHGFGYSEVYLENMEEDKFGKCLISEACDNDSQLQMDNVVRSSGVNMTVIFSGAAWKGKAWEGWGGKEYRRRL